MTNQTIIEFRNVSKTYNEKPVVKNISFSIKQGEFGRPSGDPPAAARRQP